MAFKITVTPEEYDIAHVGGEWWQRIPDEDNSSVFIVTAIHKKLARDGKYYLITGAFFNEPKFVFGSAGIRDSTPQEVAVASS